MYIYIYLLLKKGDFPSALWVFLGGNDTSCTTSSQLPWLVFPGPPCLEDVSTWSVSLSPCRDPRAKKILGGGNLHLMHLYRFQGLSKEFAPEHMGIWSLLPMPSSFTAWHPQKSAACCLNKLNVAFPWTQNFASFIRELFAIEVKANMQHSLHLSCLLKFTVPCWCDDHLCEAPQAPLWVTNTTTWIDLS